MQHLWPSVLGKASCFCEGDFQKVSGKYQWINHFVAYMSLRADMGPTGCRCQRRTQSSTHLTEPKQEPVNQLQAERHICHTLMLQIDSFLSVEGQAGADRNDFGCINVQKALRVVCHKCDNLLHLPIVAEDISLHMAHSQRHYRREQLANGSTAQHSTAQHSTAQHSTNACLQAQHKCMPLGTGQFGASTYDIKHTGASAKQEHLGWTEMYSHVMYEVTVSSKVVKHM